MTPDPTADKARVLRLAADAAAEYVTRERAIPVTPDAVALHALADLDEVTLDAPLSPAAVVELLDRIGSPATVRNTGGRFFGFVNGGVTPAGLGASVLAAAWDQNAALPVMSPIAARLDEIAAAWVVDVLGLPASSTAAFCAGATVANLTGVIAGRDELLRRVGWDCPTRGLMGAPPVDIVTSAETHISVLKTLRLAGLGTERMHLVPTDECGRLVANAMPAIERPTLIVLQAGNVNTGHSDPFAEVIGSLDRERTWVHVDGAFGLWANAAPGRRASISGVELADSWATDAHKWLNAPYDCGVVVCADGDTLGSSMRMDAAYVANDASERSAMNLGIQMSQAARAVPVWAILASLGREGVADMVEHCCRAAERFAAGLGDGGAEILAPVALNQCLVAFGDDETTDAVVTGVQASGEAWMGATTWHGRRAMRISVSDATTTDDDVDRAVAIILRTLRDTSA